jgi:hypothetical protein
MLIINEYAHMMNFDFLFKKKCLLIAMRNYIREQKRPNEFMRILNHIRLGVKESMKTYSNIDHVEKMIGKIEEETAQMILKRGVNF